ncbi:MAG TPA: recombinase family protein, partial [Steroidobacteraceae bacterium]
MTPAAPKAYSYVRFSTPEQSKGDSLRRQTSMAGAYAARHKLTLDTELTMHDLGVSAYRGKNLDGTSKLGAFLHAIKAGDVPAGSVLLVESLDRISRKEARKAVRVLEEIVEAGVDVVTLADGEKRYSKDSLDGFDFIMAVLILMRANEESRTKGKRVAQAMAAKRERAKAGELFSHIVPGWIDVTADGKRVLIPDRAAVVRRVFELFTK